MFRITQMPILSCDLNVGQPLQNYRLFELYEFLSPFASGTIHVVLSPFKGRWLLVQRDGLSCVGTIQPWQLFQLLSFTSSQLCTAYVQYSFVLTDITTFLYLLSTSLFPCMLLNMSVLLHHPVIIHSPDGFQASLPHLYHVILNWAFHKFHSICSTTLHKHFINIQTLHSRFSHLQEIGMLKVGWKIRLRKVPIQSTQVWHCKLLKNLNGRQTSWCTLTIQKNTSTATFCFPCRQVYSADFCSWGSLVSRTYLLASEKSELSTKFGIDFWKKSTSFANSTNGLC